jgi:hypothetical protein
MALQQHVETAAEADTTLATYLGPLKALVRARYPDAGFRLQSGPEPGAWLLWAHVPVEDDLDLEAALAERSTDLLVEHGVAISVVAIPKQS